MEYVAVTQSQAVAHAQRLYKEVREWQQGRPPNVGCVAKDTLILTYYVVPDTHGPVLFAGEDGVELERLLWETASICNPACTLQMAGNTREMVIKIALQVIMAWLSEQGIEDIIGWLTTHQA